MNEQITKGNWKEFKGKIREQWGDLTDDEIEKTGGNIDQIAGKIQKKYGESMDDARGKVNDLLTRINNSI